jgi:hypothetical protein
MTVCSVLWSATRYYHVPVIALYSGYQLQSMDALSNADLDMDNVTTRGFSEGARYNTTYNVTALMLLVFDQTF